MTSQSSNKFSNNLFATLFNENKAKSTSTNNSKSCRIFSMTCDEIVAERLSAQSHLSCIPTLPPRASSSRVVKKATIPAQACLCQVKEKINLLYLEKSERQKAIEVLKKEEKLLQGWKEGLTYADKAKIGVCHPNTKIFPIHKTHWNSGDWTNGYENCLETDDADDGEWRWRHDTWIQSLGAIPEMWDVEKSQE